MSKPAKLMGDEWSQLTFGEAAIVERLDYIAELLEKLIAPKSGPVLKFSEDGRYFWYEPSEVPDAER